MKIIVCFTAVLLWCLPILQNLAYANDGSEIFQGEIYDIYLKHKYTVRIHEDWEEVKIVVSLYDEEDLFDRITIWNLDDMNAEIISDTFLLLTFFRPLGTGVGLKWIKLYSVKAGKLFYSLFLNTTYNSIGALKQHKYKVNYIVKGSAYKDFYLRVQESQYLHSEIKYPPQNEEWEETFTIPFDSEEMIFANDQTILNGEFIFENRKPREKFQLENKKIKKLTLRNQEYLYINSKWYLREGKTLTEK